MIYKNKYLKICVIVSSDMYKRIIEHDQLGFI